MEQPAQDQEAQGEAASQELPHPRYADVCPCNTVWTEGVKILEFNGHSIISGFCSEYQ